MQIIYALYFILFGWVAAHTLAVIGTAVAIIAGFLILLFGKYLVSWTETHFPELHHTPGFRTKTPWHMAIATTVILLALTHISSYLVRIEAKTLQYQTGQTQIFLTIHENEDDQGEDEDNQRKNSGDNIESQTTSNSDMLEPTTKEPTITNQLVLTPDIQIILNWIVNTFNNLTS